MEFDAATPTELMKLPQKFVFLPNKNRCDGDEKACGPEGHDQKAGEGLQPSRVQHDQAGEQQSRASPDCQEPGVVEVPVLQLKFYFIHSCNHNLLFKTQN